VTCESAGQGKGSTFTLCLPRLGLEEDRQRHDRVDTPELPRTRSLRVMVVDDNVDAAAMLAMLLEASGHHVSVEHGAHAALRRAGEIAPEVCLLDIGLPDMDGIELARRLRQLPATCRSLLIATTGYGQENDRNQTRDAGFDHHLVKPIHIKQLLSILENAVH
jgi:CheY-like chemotaxis protein